MNKILFSLMFAYSYVFSCAGCVDPMVAKAGAEALKQTYDAGDKLVTDQINKLIEQANNVMKIEVMNHKKLYESSTFKIDSIAELEILKATEDSTKAIESEN